QNAQRRSESLVNTVLVTVPPCVSRSKRWKSPSTPVTLAPSAARIPSRGLQLASGTALRAEKSLLEVHGLFRQLLPPPSA
ncbi:hypothetical protein H0H93_002693, partial [Arthromyces matolae]